MLPPYGTSSASIHRRDFLVRLTKGGLLADEARLQVLLESAPAEPNVLNCGRRNRLPGDLLRMSGPEIVTSYCLQSSAISCNLCSIRVANDRLAFFSPPALKVRRKFSV
jgi:hypothetical protein